MVERLLPHDGRDRVDDVLIGDRTVLGDARLGVLVVLAAKAHQQMRDGLAEQLVLLLAPLPSARPASARRPSRARRPSPGSRSAFAW